MDYGKLFHDRSCFLRETFENRMNKYGFKSMGRMELFLWDLEIFLQIQERMKERIILKGGAAVQFYLPVDVQRTSVDIDMLFYGTYAEICSVLEDIKKEIGAEEGLFEFQEYIPKNPKTTLPLHTYFTNVPSVLTPAERRTADDAPVHQEIKAEFILETKKKNYTVMTGERIFAVNSKNKYQILSLDSLFADKLTTLGSQTIGVQDDRIDEQVKQMYDILMLIRYCFSEMDVQAVYKKYLERSEEEWNDRKSEKAFSITEIQKDVFRQLARYSQVDNGEDRELTKAINDFHALYLNSQVEYSPASVACGASFIRLVYELMMSEKNWELLDIVLRVEKRLELDGFHGLEKGKRAREIRERFIEEFSEYSALPPKTLRGKNHKRVFWAVVTTENVAEIEKTVREIEMSPI